MNRAFDRSHPPGGEERPLLPYGGRPPQHPAWFAWAIAQEPRRRRVNAKGAEIDILSWGAAGRPGVILMHGYGANAHWWSPIAPFLAADRHVVALSWSGMGHSGWRERYSTCGYAEEALIVAEREGLFAAGEKPVLVAHSLGTTPLLHLAAAVGERFRRAVLVDSGVRTTPRFRPTLATRPPHIYRSVEDAIARFRLLPPQACRNHFILDWIARHSLRTVEHHQSATSGWTWSFDPRLSAKIDVVGAWPSIAASKCPLAFVYGEQSGIVSRDLVAEQRQEAPGSPFIGIPDSDHHIMVDQPLALVSVLRTLLEIA